MNITELVRHLCDRSGLHVKQLVRVKEEDLDHTETVKHICRFGITYLPRVEFNQNIPLGNTSYKQVQGYVWNCPNCGKTYFYAQQETVNMARQQNQGHQHGVGYY